MISRTEAKNLLNNGAVDVDGIRIGVESEITSGKHVVKIGKNTVVAMVSDGDYVPDWKDTVRIIEKFGESCVYVMTSIDDDVFMIVNVAEK